MNKALVLNDPCKPSCYKKWYEGAQDAKSADIVEVLKESSFVKIIPSWEYDYWK